MDEGDDGRTRSGTVWTATTHAIAAIIGSGLVALPWSVAQLGWVIGPLSLFFFAFVTYYTSILLCDLYRSPDPVNGRRNYTYMDAVRVCLGERDELICAVIQYATLWGAIVGYTITAATSMAALKRSHCFHHKGHDARCHVSGNLFLVIFGACEIVLSQFPNLEDVTLLSITAVATSFGYSFIAASLCIAKFVSHPKLRGGLMNLEMDEGINLATRIWHCFQALGNIAFSFSFSPLLIEIQDTLRAPPPENKTMRRVNLYAIGLTSTFYISLGCIGYMAFGDDSPGNVLTGFYEPLWVVNIANVCVMVHLMTAYQVFAQPVFAMNEKWLAEKCPRTPFFNHVYTLKLGFFKRRIGFQFTLSMLLLRPVFVILTTLIAVMLPFFNAIVGLIGAIAFWPLTVYYPVKMYAVQSKIKTKCLKWKLLQGLSIFCLIVTVIAGLGSIVDIIERLKHAKLFHAEL